MFNNSDLSHRGGCACQRVGAQDPADPTTAESARPAPVTRWLDQLRQAQAAGQAVHLVAGDDYVVLHAEAAPGAGQCRTLAELDAEEAWHLLGWLLGLAVEPA